MGICKNLLGSSQGPCIVELPLNINEIGEFVNPFLSLYRNFKIEEFTHIISNFYS